MIAYAKPLERVNYRLYFLIIWHFLCGWVRLTFWGNVWIYTILWTAVVVLNNNLMCIVSLTFSEHLWQVRERRGQRWYVSVSVIQCRADYRNYDRGVGGFTDSDRYGIFVPAMMMNSCNHQIIHDVRFQQKL